MEMDVSLLNLVVKEYVFGTLKSSLPILWKLGKQFFAQLEKNFAKISQNSKQSMLLKNVLLVVT